MWTSLVITVHFRPYLYLINDRDYLKGIRLDPKMIIIKVHILRRKLRSEYKNYYKLKVYFKYVQISFEVKNPKWLQYWKIIQILTYRIHITIDNISLSCNNEDTQWFNIRDTTIHIILYLPVLEYVTSMRVKIQEII